MARILKEHPFHPDVPDELPNAEKARRLLDALAQIYDELQFQFSAIGPENYTRASLDALKIALGVPRLWSEFAEGDFVAEGTIVIYNRFLFQAMHDLEFDPNVDPRATGVLNVDWKYAS